MTVAAVRLWGTRIGAVAWDAERGVAFFEYDRAFLPSGVEVAPLAMPLSEEVYAFPALARTSFRGLPGLVADSLPDRFGHALIDAWLAGRGRAPESFDPVERLCYVGRRGIGALEYAPEVGDHASSSERLDVASLVDLANRVLHDREGFAASIEEDGPTRAVRQILQVGTSAGGARAKAVIAWNPDTGEVRSGQADAPAGFTHWILKFDGVAPDRAREVGDPQGYGRVEYAYHRMARDAGLTVPDCRLLEEGGRAHFVTRRFDRTDDGSKVHMQSLGALLHLDFDLAGAHAYEQALLAIRRLDLPHAALEEQVRRAAFNVVARNQDDHVKNIAFLMDKSGAWSLSPAFDLTYAHNPDGAWTSRHQMSLAGKRDDFTRADFTELGRAATLVRGRALAILDEVTAAVRRWPEFAAEAGVDPERADQVGATHRLGLAD